MVNLHRENQHLRDVVRECARVLQWHLGMYMRKDEQMMLGALNMAWDAVGRGFCDAPHQASNSLFGRTPPQDGVDGKPPNAGGVP